jgi:predicted Fe-Mo cluster-binding NifX family protein
MKICVTATAANLEAQIDPRFGRCSYFVIVNSETMRFEAIPNMAAGVSGGAGIQAAQTIANKDVKLLITGNVGPKAFQALSAAGIEVITGAFGTVREAVEKLKKGELNKTGVPTVGGHFGMGGKGGGRGVWRP